MSRIVYIFLFVILSGCGESKYCHLVQVENEQDFNGKWLKTRNKPQLDKILLVDDCKKIDEEVDRGDGEKKGKVRWARCLSGPDCNEAGDF